MKEFIRQHYKWILFLLLISLGSLAGELINSRFTMSDLEVYHKTAVRLMQGEELYRSVEENPWEFYVFKYSPPSAFLFIPFSFTGFEVAKFLYWAFLTIIFGHILYLLYNTYLPGRKVNKSISLSLILAMAITGTHFFRELHLGQVNLLLLWLYTIALYAFNRKKDFLMAAVLAMSLFIKPFALIFIPLLLITKRYRASLYLLAVALLIFFMPLIFYPDLSNFMNLYASWIKELGIELGNKQELLNEGNHTIFSVLARHSVLKHIEFSAMGKLVYQLLALLAIAGLLLYFLLKDRTEESFLKIFLILIAIIPLLAFTSYNAFIFTLPLLAFLLFNYRILEKDYKLIFIISCWMIGGNIYDLVGPTLFDLFWAVSVYSWGTIGLILITLINWSKLHISPSKQP